MRMPGEGGRAGDMGYGGVGGRGWMDEGLEGWVGG